MWHLRVQKHDPVYATYPCHVLLRHFRAVCALRTKHQNEYGKFQAHLVVGQVVIYRRAHGTQLCELDQLIPKYFYLEQLKFLRDRRCIRLGIHFLESATQVLPLQQMHQINPSGFRDR